MSESQRRHVPGWLRRLRGWQEAPDWLLDLIQEEGGFTFTELGARPEEAGFAPTEGLEGDDGTQVDALLEWERVELRPEPPTGEEDRAASEAELPEEGAGPAPAPRRSGVTDWLRELEDEGAQGDVVSPPAEMRERSDWTEDVKELASETTDRGVEPGSEGEEAEPPARRSGITDWLTLLESEPPTAAEAGPRPVEPPPERLEEEGKSDDVPDWLTDLQAPAPEEDTSEESAGAEVPDWLADLEAEPAEEDRFADRETGLPPWLSTLEGDETEEDVPEWLSDLDSGGGIAAWLSEQEEEATRPPEAGDREEEVAELPPGPPAELDRTAPEEAGLQEDQLPEWLRGMEGGSEDQEPESGRDTGAVALPPAQESDLAEDTTVTEDAGVPDWLRDLGATEQEQPAQEQTPDVVDSLAGQDLAPPEESTAELTEDETPDWLLALGEEDVEQEPAPSMEAPPEVVEDETPDWLLALGEEDAEQEPASPTEAPPEVVEDETPDWLLALGEEGAEQEPASPTEAPPEVVEDETPDWLLALDEEDAEQEPASPAEGPPEVVADETPDWLLALDEAGEEVESAPPTEEITEAETPAWLRDLDEVIEEGPPASGLSDQDEQVEPASVAGPVETGEEEVEAAAGEEDLPDWLRDLATGEREPETDLSPGPGGPAPDWFSLDVPSAPGAGPEEEEGAASEEPAPPVPEWMEGVYAPRDEPPADEEVLSLPPAERWPDEEAPEWLAALGDEGARRAGPDSTVEASGPLAGLSGVLSPEPILANLPKSAFQPVPPVPDAHQAEAELVERALETPASRRIQVSHATGREILNSLGRWVMYGLLLAAVLIAPLRSCVRLPDFGETRTFYTAIERLPSDSAVLVVFDYDASLDGTLTPQARAILWHLQRQNLAIVLLSLTPQGAAIAEDLIAEREGLVSGRDYIDLGYLPPHPASLLAFMGNPLGGAARFGSTEDPADTVLGRQVRTFADLDTIITITGDRDHIRWWIEQIQPRAETELLAAVPAAITPYVEPYYSELGTGQIVGVLGGLGPTAQYEELLQADFVPSARLSYLVQTNALLLFTGVVLVSGLGSLLGALSRQRKPGKAQVG
jgi:hypothetical protein